MRLRLRVHWAFSLVFSHALLHSPAAAQTGGSQRSGSLGEGEVAPASGAAPSPPAGSSPSAPPPVTETVASDSLMGVGLVTDHYDDVGYPESAEGLLVIEVDPEVGPITWLRGAQPHYLEAQVVNVQRDGVFLAREGPIDDVLPDGTAHRTPYGYGAVKRTLTAVTLVEAQLQPHLSDNQKTYEPFPLRDFYLGAGLSLVGVRGEVRYVDKERYVGYAQVGVNLPALSGLEFNRTFRAFAVPVALGGGIRYPSLVGIIGTNWTTGAELSLGFFSIDDDARDTGNAIALPGLFHEVEWSFQRDVGVSDHRSDPRPSNYGVQSFFAKLGAYADFFGGVTHGLLFDIHVGYRYNFQGPTIPPHEFKETQVTFASERYVQRRREEAVRQRQLEELRRSRIRQVAP